MLIAPALPSDDDGPPPLDPDLGGDTTRHSTTRTSFSFPAPNLTRDERRTFEVGDSLFNQNWVTAPASTDARDGLGPMFNAQACSSCHVLDGRGVPPTPTGDTVPIGLLLRLSVPGETPTGAPADHPVYGGQLQDRSILGVPAEGTLDVSFTTVEGTYADGTPYTLVAPTYAIGDPQFGEFGDDTMFSPRLAPQVIGMGLLEEIPADDIFGRRRSRRRRWRRDLRAAQPACGTKAPRRSCSVGSAGRPMWPRSSNRSPERSTVTLESPRRCIPSRTARTSQEACAAAIGGGDPELTDEQLANVTFYGRTLSVPAMRDVDSPEVIDGAALFDSFGCASCHTPTHHTGDSDVATLANQEIHPYTDLLLHDMGPGLADGRPDFEATGEEWRTPPLWGIGLVDDLAGARYLLHDGRAATIEEAILWHGGEGEDAATAFREAAVEDRRRLLAFVEAL